MVQVQLVFLSRPSLLVMTSITRFFLQGSCIVWTYYPLPHGVSGCQKKCHHCITSGMRLVLLLVKENKNRTRNGHTKMMTVSPDHGQTWAGVLFSALEMSQALEINLEINVLFHAFPRKCHSLSMDPTWTRDACYFRYNSCRADGCRSNWMNVLECK